MSCFQYAVIIMELAFPLQGLYVSVCVATDWRSVQLDAFKGENDGCISPNLVYSIGAFTNVGELLKSFTQTVHIAMPNDNIVNVLL